MTALLIKLFVKDAQNTSDKKVRGRYLSLGVTTGIFCNCILVVIKMIIGFIAGSGAIIADGFNNLSDTGSSIITKIGYKLSERPSDEEHPFGHGRLEYISALAVGVIIILVGFELFKSSLTKIFHPAVLNIEPFTVIALAVSILMKFWMYLFNKKIGRTIRSNALIATAQDSMNDCIATFAVLVSGIIYLCSGGNINIDAYVGTAVALFILYSGIMTIRDTIHPLLGTPPEKETIQAIEQLVFSYDKFVGIHDLIVHNYGPGRSFASLHVEVPSDVDIVACHEDVDACEKRIKTELGLEIVLHIDPIAVNDEQTNEVRCKVSEGLKIIDERLTMHDFRMVDGQNNINLIFDVVLPSGSKLSDAVLRAKITEVCRLIDRRYTPVVTIDHDYSTTY